MFDIIHRVNGLKFILKMTSKNNRRKCIVPCCGYRKNASDDDVRSLFKCPKDANKAYSWAKQIPGISFLLPSHHVCENHFEDRFKIKEINVSLYHM